MAIYKTPVGERPLIITVVHDDDCVNGRVIMDIYDPHMNLGMKYGLDYHLTSVLRGDGEGQWRFYDD